MKPGDYVIARRNHLVRYTKYQDNGEFEKVIITFDEAFLKKYLERHPMEVKVSANVSSFLFVKENRWMGNFIKSLEPYYNGEQQLDEIFADVKREELLLILLETEPGLADVLFNFGNPEKIDLQTFMNKNFRFNISLDRFAFLTGRSLSSFKRDFQKTFGEAPGNWLKRKRLEEAYFQIHSNNLQASEVYMDVGFENLSHFSYAFKKQFGISPRQASGK